MEELVFRPDPRAVSRQEIWRAMGYGDKVPEEMVLAMVEDVISRVVPETELRCMYGVVRAQKTSPGEVELGGTRFAPGPIICSYLKGMTDACVFVATAGEGFAKASALLHEEGNIVLDFIADSLGSVLADAAVSLLADHLSDAVIPTIGDSMKLSLPYSPGYCGWDIREQKSFFSLFPDNPCGVLLSDSCLMRPEKSVSGFFAVGTGLVPQPYRCEVCNNPKCYRRKK